jgi:hypothetical protein
LRLRHAGTDKGGYTAETRRLPQGPLVVNFSIRPHCNSIFRNKR